MRWEEEKKRKERALPVRVDHRQQSVPGRHEGIRTGTRPRLPRSAYCAVSGVDTGILHCTALASPAIGSGRRRVAKNCAIAGDRGRPGRKRHSGPLFQPAGEQGQACMVQ
jgi:hypothetical protein